MESKRNKHSVDVVFVLMVVCLFAACSLFIILLGGQVFGNIQKRTEANDQTRTGISYVLNKIRAYDEKGAVSIGDKNGISCLVLTQGGYHTQIYWYDGALREIVADPSLPFQPETGEKIAAALGFDVTTDGNLLTITVVDPSGNTVQCAAALRSASVAGGAQ